ncbi:MAG: efflux transporter periplasmic adaptor subunit [Gemmataceae bacterium]|nr:efflux transporter periplasmic adaptor subunit [Gemmataceae bacterium]
MRPKSSAYRWVWWVLAALGLAGVGAGGWYAFAQSRSTAEARHAEDADQTSGSGVAVEVVLPKPGGIQRTVTQPGTAEPFEAADLYTKVSGFLVEQPVDIGKRVEKGEVLARIAAPEHEKQVERNRAKVRLAEAKVKQMDAHKVAAEAEARAADAAIALARVMVKAKAAFRQYRERQLSRIKDLVAKHAESERLQDEQEDYYLSALEAENAARENVNTAQERAAAAHAKIAQAEADLDEAKADVGVAEAELATAQVWVDYAVIRSPYTGVITKRNFHPPGKLPPGSPPAGAFVKSADEAGSIPLLTVERTDVLRVVIAVPDRDVPLVAPGKPAVLKFDALPDRVYQTEGDNKVVVSRVAEAEDYQTRLMRVEVDVKNTDGQLRRGMFGSATLILSPGSPGAVKIPSDALVARSGEVKKGTVRVVRDGKIQTLPVQYGMDNGVEVEILAGLDPHDQVVTRTSVPVADGTPVTVTTAGKAGH